MLRNKHHWIFFLALSTSIATALFVEDLVREDFTTFAELFPDYLTDIPVFFAVVVFLGWISNVVINTINKKVSWQHSFNQRFFLDYFIILILTLAFSTAETALVQAFDADPRGKEEGGSFQLVSMLIYLFTFLSTFFYFEISQLKISTHNPI